MSVARTIPCKDFEVKSASRPFSFFNFYDERLGDCRPMRKILTQARLSHVKSLVIEKIPLSDDIKYENQDLSVGTAKKRDSFKGSQVLRISFFRRRIRKTNPGDIKYCDNNDFIGYAIVKMDTFSKRKKDCRVYESVMTPNESDNSFIHSANTFEAKIYGHRFEVTGCVYAQQNAITNVCAHTALVTLLSSTQRDNTITSNMINKELGIDFSKQTFEKEGLTADQITDVIKNHGMKYFGFKEPPKNAGAAFRFERYLYSSVESGFVGLLGFELQTSRRLKKKPNHVVPVIGHTFEPNAWISDAEHSYFRIKRTIKYFPSYSWAASLIIHDDNFGSYYCLPLRYFDMEHIKIQFYVGTLPKNISSDPVAIEPIAHRFLAEIVGDLAKYDLRRIKWLQRLRDHAQDQEIVLRTLLIAKEEYLRFLKHDSDWSGRRLSEGSLSFFSKNLPKQFWMTEISIPHLYAGNMRKLGEILLRSDLQFRPQQELDRSLFLLARLPACFAVVSEKKKTSFDFFETKMAGHTSFYRK